MSTALGARRGRGAKEEPLRYAHLKSKSTYATLKSSSRQNCQLKMCGRGARIMKAMTRSRPPLNPQGVHPVSPPKKPSANTMVKAVHRNHYVAAMLRNMGQVDLRVKNPCQGNPNNAIRGTRFRLMGKAYQATKKVVIKTRPADRRASAAIIGRTAAMR